MRITILGCGAYGMALAKMFGINSCKIKMWNKFDNVFEDLRRDNPDIFFTNMMSSELFDSDLIVIAIPVAFLEDTIIQMKEFYDNQDILIASKGICIDNGLFASEVIGRYFPLENIGVISGGTFAVDMINKKVMGLTLGTSNEEIQEKVKNALESRFLKIQYIDDLIGVQICGAVKNVMAIGFGMLDGAGYPESSRFLFLTEAIYEIRRLIGSLNGNKETIMSYAGIDDIMMTCTSSKSRNYCFGKLIGEGKSYDEIEKYKKNTTIEGLGTSMAIHNLCLKKNLEMPICDIIFKILYENYDASLLIQYLEEKES